MNTMAYGAIWEETFSAHHNLLLIATVAPRFDGIKILQWRMLILQQRHL
jgi:hypothetical protein